MKSLAPLVLLSIPVLLGAQTPADSSAARHDAVTASHPDSLAPVLDHTFNGPGEFVRFFMAGHQVYRAMVNREDVQLVVEPVLPSGSKVSVIELQRFRDASGEREYLIRPAADGDYQIRVPFGPVLDTSATGRVNGARSGSTRLLLYRDSKETKRENAPQTYAWSFGIEFAGGAGQMYSQNGGGAVSGTASAFEGCLAARYGSGIGRILSGCLVGVRHESPHGQRSVTWVFMEPRFRLVGAGSRWDKPLDAGLSFRAGLGQFDRLNVQPGVLAPGAYVDYTLVRRPHWPKLVLEGAARYDVVIISGLPSHNSAEGTVGLGIF